MKTYRVRLLAAVLSVAVFGLAPPAQAADNYAVDPMHAAATFKVSHLGLSWTYGRFKDVSGSFTVDPSNPANTKFEFNSKVESLDSDNAKRDEHLRGPDFFNAKQFPTVIFKSTAVKPIENGYQVTGDLTLHGVTKPITIALVGGRKAEMPTGVMRTGYSCEFSFKRSDYGMDKMTQAIGDEVFVSWSFEGIKK